MKKAQQQRNHIKLSERFDKPNRAFKYMYFVLNLFCRLSSIQLKSSHIRFCDEGDEFLYVVINDATILKTKPLKTIGLN